MIDTMFKALLDSWRSRLFALLSYANRITGAQDSSIGDAIKTLCDGYGGGPMELLYERNDEILLSDTNLYNITPSTTAQEIYPGQTNAFQVPLSEVIDLDKEDIFVFTSSIIEPKYNENVLPRVLAQGTMWMDVIGLLNGDKYNPDVISGHLPGNVYISRSTFLRPDGTLDVDGSAAFFINMNFVSVYGVQARQTPTTGQSSIGKGRKYINEIRFSTPRIECRLGSNRATIDTINALDPSTPIKYTTLVYKRKRGSQLFNKLLKCLETFDINSFKDSI